MKIVTMIAGIQITASAFCSTKILLMTFFIIQALAAVVAATVAISANASR